MHNIPKFVYTELYTYVTNNLKYFFICILKSKSRYIELEKLISCPRKISFSIRAYMNYVVAF